MRYSFFQHLICYTPSSVKIGDLGQANVTCSWERNTMMSQLHVTSNVLRQRRSTGTRHSRSCSDRQKLPSRHGQHLLNPTVQE
jgi:hypothetical protein